MAPSVTHENWYDERSADDAPVWFSAEEASAWASGWNSAVEACAKAQNAALEAEAVRNRPAQSPTE